VQIGASPPAGAVANGMTISGSYGLFLPDIGAILLNASALRFTCSGWWSSIRYSILLIRQIIIMLNYLMHFIFRNLYFK
jgi:hypothetical protein